LSQKQTILPHILSFTHQEATDYHRRLRPIDFSYHDLPFLYGYPTEITATMAKYLVDSASTVYESIKQAIRERGGLTDWLADHAPRLGDEVLNYHKINEQLEKRIFEEELLFPMIYDGLLVLEHGRVSFKVTEIQSCIGYGPAHRCLLQAAGWNPDGEGAWLGPENPQQVLYNSRQKLAKGKEITVLDTDPYHGSGQIDQLLMAQTLAGPHSLPLAARDIRFDSEMGYYHFRYAIDTQTGKPLLDTLTGTLLKTEERVPITAVLARMIQPDLDELEVELATDPVQRLVIQRFFRDESLIWLQHPAWQYIIDKSTLPYIRKILQERKSPLAADFVPVYGPGEYVPPGKYMRKPTREAGGTGQDIRRVRPGERVQVEDEYIYQQFFVPYPLPVQLPEELSKKFPVPTDIPDTLGEDMLFAGWRQDITATSLELRAMSLPWGQGEHSMYFMSRLAPRYADASKRTFTQTNILKMSQVLRETIDVGEWWRLPFGWCPVRIVE
jgi:hypothetical protein